MSCFECNYRFYMRLKYHQCTYINQIPSIDLMKDTNKLFSERKGCNREKTLTI